MKLSVLDLNGAPKGEVALDDKHVIKDGRGTQALQDYVVAYNANQRQGTRSAKTRAEVAGSGKKPWRQKGTGRARAGSFQSPLWVGGGVVFGPRPRSFAKKVNARTKQLALRKALSERLKAGDVLIVDDFNLSAPKTKEVVAVITALEIDGTATIVATGENKNLALAVRNLPNLWLTTSETLNTYDVLRPDKLIFTKGAFEKIEARLNK